MDENQIFGIIVVLVCSIGYFFAWKFASREKMGVAILLLFGCGLLLRVFVSTDFFLHQWDERYHALVAKNLMHHMLIPTLYENPVFHFSENSWTSGRIWLHKQPVPLWIMAISMNLFGVNEIALRLPSIVLSTLSIGLTYRIGKFFFSSKVGFVAAFLFSLNGLILELTGGRIATDHIDIFFLFFIELCIFFILEYSYKRKPVYNILAAMSLGAALLSKWLPALIVLPIWLLLVSDSKLYSAKQIIRSFTVFLFFTLAIALPWQFYIYHYFPIEAHAESLLNFQHFTRVLDQQDGPIYYFIDKVRINYGELIYLPLLWFLWITFRDMKNLKQWALVIWSIIPILFFSFSKTKMQGYIVFVSPALFIMTAAFFYRIKEMSSINKWVIRLVLFLLIALPVRYSIERLKPFELRNRNPEWVDELRKMNTEKINNGLLLNYKAPIEAMFYTNLTVYPDLPDTDRIEDSDTFSPAVKLNENGSLCWLYRFIIKSKLI